MCLFQLEFNQGNFELNSINKVRSIVSTAKLVNGDVEFNVIRFTYCDNDFGVQSSDVQTAEHIDAPFLFSFKLRMKPL